MAQKDIGYIIVGLCKQNNINISSFCVTESGFKYFCRKCIGFTPENSDEVSTVVQCGGIKL